ncbi:MAG: ROK family protein [Deltaproteobacteria bacterium]|nr:ROK family protein [Deltaproteobacteria bacterium]
MTLAASRPLFASADLGGTNIAAVLADEEGRIAARGTMPTLSYEGPEAVVARIGDLIESLAQKVGQRPAALGIGVPGMANLQTGETLFLPNLTTQWRNVPVRQWLAPRLGCDVYLLNDVRMAALGELAYGHGKHVRNFAFYALGTGVGGGIVMDGKLVLGRSGSVGELGHQTVDPNGLRCGCGNRGCLELYISGPALTAEGVRLLLSGQAPRLYDMVGGDFGKISVKLLGEAAAAGDDRVQASLVRAAQCLGIGIANTITTIHPEMIVIGGGVAGLGEPLFATVRQVIKERVGMFPTDDIRVEPSLLGDQAGTLGGVALAVRRGLQDNSV